MRSMEPAGPEVASVYDRIEPLYTLRVACELIPMPSIGALYQFLMRNKAEFPARYHRSRDPWPFGAEIRFLTESEILRIREMTFYEGSRRCRVSSGGALAGVLRRCAEVSSG